MTATDPTPQPATHASGPRAGQPVTQTPVEQLVEHIAHHRPPGRPVVDCQWCPEPEPEQVPVVVLEDALCRRVWAAAYRDAARRMREFRYRQAESELLGVVNSIDAGMPGPWADQPEQLATPTQPAQDDPRDYYPMHDHGYGRHSHHVAQKHAGDVANPRANDHSGLPRVTQQEADQPTTGPTPEPTGPAILGRALIDRDGDIWPMRADGSYGSGHPRDYFDDAYGPVREVLLVDPSVARVLDAVGQWRRACRDGDDPALWADGADLALIAAWDALGEPTPDDQYRCPVTHPAHGQCELYQGHRPADTDPDRWHRTGALLWLTDAEIRACALPPLASYAGTADLQSGPANASGEPAVGPGWDRETIERIARGEETGVRYGLRTESAAQLRALLADRDLLAGRDRALRVEAEISNGLRTELAEVTESEIRARADQGRLEEELVDVRSECDRLRGQVRLMRTGDAAYWQAQQVLDEVLGTQEADGSGGGLADEVRLLADQRDAARNELATARRDAAADALDYGARWIRQVFADGIDPEVAKCLDALAVTTRNGTRPVPGSPEPDGGGDDG
jgi:hypothetical protein